MDPAKILIWNVRGLNSSATQDSIATLVSTTRVNIVCLQETKFATVSQRILLSMLGSDFSNFVELPPPGASGGILVAWKNSVGSTRQVKVGVHSVLVQFRLQAGQTWWLTCVYGPRANDEKINSCKNYETSN
jgi:exonuclease III